MPEHWGLFISEPPSPFELLGEGELSFVALRLSFPKRRRGHRMRQVRQVLRRAVGWTIGRPRAALHLRVMLAPHVRFLFPLPSTRR